MGYYPPYRNTSNLHEENRKELRNIKERKERESEIYEFKITYTMSFTKVKFSRAFTRKAVMEMLQERKGRQGEIFLTT